MLLDPTVPIVFATLFLAFVATLVYSYWYQSLKHKAKHGAAGQSLKVSELEEIIRSAVGDAMSDLDGRLTALQQEVRSLRAAIGDDRRRPQQKQETLLDRPKKEALLEPSSQETLHGPPSSESEDAANVRPRGRTR